jgi:hypothetical protein
LLIHFPASEKAFGKHMKSERIFSWYNLVSYVNIAYKARHALMNFMPVAKVMLQGKVYE